MAAVDERLIDPTPQRVASLLQRAVKAANGRASRRRVEKDPGFWARFVKRARNKREGNQTYCGTRVLVYGSAFVRAAWWTDPVGRRHWRIVGRRAVYADYRARDLPLAAFPLWHIYPDRLVLRDAGSGSHLIARCDCGVAGRPESIAWMGERCGPCHDRAEEGVAVRPAGPMVLRGKTLSVNQLAFAGPDALLSSGSGRVVRWDLEDGGEEVLLHRRGGHVYALAASASGLAAASTACNRVLVRRPDTPDWRQVNLRCQYVGGLAISPDERWLAVVGQNSYLIGLEAPDLAARLVLSGRRAGPLAFSPDGRSLYVLDAAAGLHRIDAASGRADLVRGRPDSEPNTLNAFFMGLTYYPWSRAMACSHDGRWLAVVAAWDGRSGTQLGDLATGRWFGLRAPAAACSQALAFTADGALASADSDGALRLWDVARQELRQTLVLAQSGPGYQVPAFSADGERVALWASDGSIHLVSWRAMT
jgi:hypothetical protein